MKNQFSLSKSNQVYLAIVGVIWIGLFLASSNLSSEGIGALVGALLALGLFPYLIASVVWRLSGRSNRGGSWTFNICLTLLILGQVGQASVRYQQVLKAVQMQESKSQFKSTALTTDDPAQFDSAYDEYRDSVQETFTELSETTTGSDKRFFEIMNGFVSEARSGTDRWNESYNSISSERFFDLSRLNSDEEFDWQIRTAKRYVTETRNYFAMLENMLSELKERLSVLGEGNKAAVGAIKGASEVYYRQKPIYEPLVTAHMEYGSGFIQLLELLQENRESWTFENDEILINNDSMAQEYNNWIDYLAEREELINALSAQLIETL